MSAARGDRPDLPRIPPGQTVAQNWPVLHYGEVPAGTRPWRVRLFGAVQREVYLPLEEIQRLRSADIPADVHCVSGWSLLDNAWTGAPFTAVEAMARPLPSARFLMAHAAGGWSTNIPLTDCRRPDVALVWARNGVPLPAVHGGPLRLLVPHLYLWKSCKWLVALEWMIQDRPGFWEKDSKYTNLDPWAAVRGREKQTGAPAQGPDDRPA